MIVTYFCYLLLVATDPELQAVIAEAIAEYHAKTFKFVAYDGSQANYVAITDDSTGCSSFVGRIGGKQSLKLNNPGCVRRVNIFIISNYSDPLVEY